jgi:hypothetical protein
MARSGNLSLLEKAALVLGKETSAPRMSLRLELSAFKKVGTLADIASGGAVCKGGRLGSCGRFRLEELSYTSVLQLEET